MSEHREAGPVRPSKIVSGGQTGVDRGALDAAIELGIAHGGWCPRARLAEDGTIPPRYALTETGSPEYHVRTERNVLDSDATLILCRGRPSGGTELTLRLARQYGRSCMVVDLEDPPAAEEVFRWIDSREVRVLNVAGPRESQCPGISVAAREFIFRVFARR